MSDKRVEQLEAALKACRKAAGSGQSMTNRMQFIYARAGAALAGEDWSEEWKAEYGYNLRDRTLLENERLAAALARLTVSADRIIKEELAAYQAALNEGHDIGDSEAHFAIAARRFFLDFAARSAP